MYLDNNYTFPKSEVQSDGINFQQISVLLEIEQ